MILLYCNMISLLLYVCREGHGPGEEAAHRQHQGARRLRLIHIYIYIYIHTYIYIYIYRERLIIMIIMCIYIYIYTYREREREKKRERERGISALPLAGLAEGMPPPSRQRAGPWYHQRRSLSIYL